MPIFEIAENRSEAWQAIKLPRDAQGQVLTVYATPQGESSKSSKEIGSHELASGSAEAQIPITSKPLQAGTTYAIEVTYVDNAGAQVTAFPLTSASRTTLVVLDTLAIGDTSFEVGARSLSTAAQVEVGDFPAFGPARLFDTLPPPPPPNLAPRFTSSIPPEATEGEELVFAVTATDADGDTVTITNPSRPSGASFTQTGPGAYELRWTPPAGFADGVGSAFFRFVASDGNLSDTLEGSVSVSVTPPQDTAAPSITSVSFAPSAPEPTDAVTVTAAISDAGTGVASAAVRYAVAGGAEEALAMTRVSGTAADGTYEATIPAQGESEVAFYVRATDQDGNAADSATQTYAGAALDTGGTFLYAKQGGPYAANADGTGTVAAGEAVAYWGDTSGNGTHLKQTDASLRPLLEEGGLLVFDGSGDHMRAEWGEIQPPYRIMIAAQLREAGTNDIKVFYDGVSPNTECVLFEQNGFYRFSGGALDVPADAEPHVFDALYEEGRQTLRVDDGQSQSVTGTPSEPLAGITVGANDSLSRFFPGRFGAMAILGGAAATDAAVVADVQTYLEGVRDSFIADSAPTAPTISANGSAAQDQTVTAGEDVTLTAGVTEGYDRVEYRDDETGFVWAEGTGPTAEYVATFQFSEADSAGIRIRAVGIYAGGSVSSSNTITFIVEAAPEPERVADIHYTLDANQDGVWVDESGRYPLTGNALEVPGLIGGAARVQGDAAHMLSRAATGLLSGTEPFFASVWFKDDTLSGEHDIMGVWGHGRQVSRAYRFFKKGDDLHFSISADGENDVQVSVSDQLTGDGTWRMGSIIIDASTFQVALDDGAWESEPHNGVYADPVGPDGNPIPFGLGGVFREFDCNPQPSPDLTFDNVIFRGISEAADITPEFRTFLYNDGQGRTPDEIEAWEEPA